MKNIFLTAMLFMLSFSTALARGTFSTQAHFVAVVSPGCYEVLVIVQYTDDYGQTSVVASGNVLIGKCPPKTHMVQPGTHAGCPAETYEGDYFTTMEGSRECLAAVIKNPEVYALYKVQRDQIIADRQ